MGIDHSSMVLSGLDDIRSRMNVLAESVSESSPTAEIMTQVLTEFQVMYEELLQQNEELLDARLQIEAERMRYHDLFEHAPDGYLVTDADGTIREANRAAAAMLGRPQHFLEGKPLVVFLADGMRRAFRSALITFREEEQPQEITVRLEPPTRKPLDVALTVAAVRDNEGNTVGLRWLMRDVTQHKIVEERILAFNTELEGRVAERTADLASANVIKDELLQREQIARAEAESARQNMALLAEVSRRLASSLDYESTILAVAHLIVPALGDWCVVDVIDVGSIRRVAVVHRDPERQRLAFELHRVVTPSLDAESGVARVLRSRTTEIFTDGSFFLLPNEVDDTPIAGLLRELGIESGICVPLIARDQVLGVITCVHATAPQFLASTEVALMEDVAGRVALAIDNALLYRDAQEAIWTKDQAFSILDTFLENTPIGIAFIDRELRYRVVNNTLAQLTGISVADHIGRRVSELLPRAGVLVERSIRYVLETGQPLLNVELTGEVSTSPGVQRDWLISYYPVRSTFGELLGSGVIVTEMTERKQWERELQNAKETAEQASNAKDRFLAMLSHELRTPLMPTLIAINALAKEIDLSPDVRDLVELIQRNIELEARLIDDLLDLTAVSKGKLRLRPEIVDAHALLRHVLETCRADIGEKHVLIVTDLAAQSSQVVADSARLQQVFWNLLKNAIKFVPAEAGTITIRTENVGGDIQVRISDNGVGIPVELLPRIFDEFVQGEESSSARFPGLGLGLSICRTLTHALGGTITAESEGIGQGATFIVTLRTAGREQGEGSRQSNARKLQQLESRAWRILIVEDHRDTRMVMESLLKRYGYRVMTADCVESAWQLATSHDFDVIISDIGLPDGSGIDLMRRLYQVKPVKAIAISGFGMEEDIRESIEAGFQRHLTKPFTTQRLREVIQEVLS